MNYTVHCLLFLITSTSLCQDAWLNAFKSKNPASFLGSWLPLSDQQKMRLGSIVGVLSSDPLDFSKEEYERYMEFVKEIDSEVYAQMKEGEAKTGVPALQKTKYIEGEGIGAGPEEAPGYPIIWIQSLSAKNNDQDAFISALTKLIADYKTAYIPPITKYEQQQVMEILKDIAPDLYELIAKIDPTGENHIKRTEYPGQGASVIASRVDGLPIILLDADEIKLPHREFRYTIAHELGHYVLHSVLDNTRTLTSLTMPAHRILSSKEIATQEFKKGKKISGQLPFEESFQLAYSRVQEHEADKFAIIEMGIPIDDAIASSKRLMEKYDSELENPEKETFKITHPLWADRIKQFELLRPEVELNKIRNTKRQPIDWQALAEQYLQKYSAQ